VFLIGAISVVVASLFVFSASYASFIREHKSVRYYVNPHSYINALGKYVDQEVSFGEVQAFERRGEDALIPAADTDRELIVMVVGETARADRFSLNGYEKKTNPLLEKENVISFSDFYSCGTSTAVSVPCMFSLLGKNDFTNAKANYSENVLDVLTRAGVSVLWRDNNSSSKGVADRVTYQDFRKPAINPDCDLECRDVGMLEGLQAYIDSIKSGDILIVLHQMGNHGPAYYKRYPKEFEVFTPTCQSNQLGTCSTEEINNSYDNVIVYTDYFLSKVISLLKDNSPAFEAAMFYVSDHGESLGEKGIYLHGLPYAMAPKEQTHVPALMWFGEGMDIDQAPIKEKRHQLFNHDYVSHTLLGFMEVESLIYNPNLDILSAPE
jgi:lipid A ethanolaminephosphotransferase